MKTKSKFAEFYALLKIMGISNEDRRDFIADYTDGVTDSLTVLIARYPIFYSDMIRHMHGVVDQMKTNKPDSDLDKLRKRVIASIGGYLKITALPHDINYIKGMACKATGYKSFNAIPKERLRNVYGAFNKMQKDFEAVGSINQERLKRAVMMN